MDEITNIPTPTTPADAKNVSVSGAENVDGLLWGTAFNSEGSGAATSISYSFSGPGNSFSSDSQSGYSYGFGEPWADIEGLESSEAAEFTDILQNIEQSINISFQEVSETNSKVGTIRIAWTGYERPENSAWAYFPADTASAGDIWLNSDVLDPNRHDLFFRSLLVHEMGHALGLKHPDEARSNFPILTSHLDGVDQTIMSYNPSSTVQDAVATDLWPQSLMALDIAALQYIYGASTKSNGDDVYSYSTRERHYETIWDGGGTDTLSFNGSYHLNINLSPGSWSDLGTTVHYWDKNSKLLPEIKTETLFITQDTIIENIVADMGHDSLLGNAANNYIQGASGHDSIKGAEGSDQLIGGSGSDFIAGDGGSDTISGGTGHDRIFAGTNDNAGDLIAGGSGNDTIGGGPGNDLLVGAGVTGVPNFKDGSVKATDHGDDALYGGSGNDTLVAGGWANDVRENASFDQEEARPLEDEENQLWGGPDDDLLIGSYGDDTLIGCADHDTMTGESGADTFVFATNHGHDVITDFDITSDSLDFSLLENTLPSNLTDIAKSEERDGKAGVTLQTSDTSSIFLENISLEELSLLTFHT